MADWSIGNDWVVGDVTVGRLRVSIWAKNPSTGAARWFRPDQDVPAWLSTVVTDPTVWGTGVIPGGVGQSPLPLTAYRRPEGVYGAIYDAILNTPATGATQTTPPPPRLVVNANRLYVNTSTTFPTPVMWSDDGNIQTIIRNPSTSTQVLYVGVGTYGSANPVNPGIAVAIGSEYVSGQDPRPLFARFPTTADYATVYSIKDN